MSISLPRPVARAFSGLAAALLPQSCLLCGADAGAALCAGCAGELPWLPQPRCGHCALPTPAGETCGRCLAHPPRYDATTAALAYAYPLDRLVHWLKYGGGLPVAAYFATLLGAAPPAGGELLLPVPLHPARLRRRGYNQAQEIARGLARRWRLPLRPRLAERLWDSPPQAGLAWKERARNVRGAFRIAGDVAGRHVVVVDDVMTTGATLDELAGALKRHGALRVTNCVVARTLEGG